MDELVQYVQRKEGIFVSRKQTLIEGNILQRLLLFMLPILFALLLQAMYGAVDLMITGRFAESADVSGVSTGSQIMQTATTVITGLAMGITVIVARRIGEAQMEQAAETIGSGIAFFAVMALIVSVLMTVFSPALAIIMHAPDEAFGQTVTYIRICSTGMIAVVAYNLLGSIFRGLGDSRTPLMTVAFACAANIMLDLLLVEGFHLGAAGAAIATVIAQLLSVLISFAIIIRRRQIVPLKRRHIVMKTTIIRQIIKIGFPIALQDFLVGISFLVILAIVNALGLIASAGVGVAEKVCAFIMLVPSAFMQAMSAFVAQNMGAGKPERAKKALHIGIGVSEIFAVCMFILTFTGGRTLCSIFTGRMEVALAGADYLKAYAIDCLLTSFLFCYIGYFDGLEKTHFVMIQGLVGAFLIRIPVAFVMSRILPVSLFRIGLATPCSSMVQILLCMLYMRQLKEKNR